MDVGDAVKTDGAVDPATAREPGDASARARVERPRTKSDSVGDRKAGDEPTGRGETIAEKTPGRENKTNDGGPPKQPEEPAKRSSFGLVKDHPIAAALIAALLCVAIAGGIWWWLATRDFETTDDAFIDGRPVAIGALVAGEIVDVPVTDNQLVPAGTVLARIDARDYLAAQAQAQAQIDQARAGVANIAAQVETQQSRIDQSAKQITEAQAALNFSKDENSRYQNLVQQGAGTVQRAQQASSDLQGKQAAVDGAEAAHVEALKQLDVLRAQKATGEAQVRQAEAQSGQAGANLARVVLTAPVEGRVTKLTAAAGAYAAPGQTFMILVPTDLWVTANYKETQLLDMRPGQAVTIAIDAYGRQFSGRVDSLQAGSGTAFSLLPAENATGNYVKVVQRVPVKIVFDKPPDVAIGPGMSVTPSVKVR
jgi:membrane fusion protein (multidrug efflux system)